MLQAHQPPVAKAGCALQRGSAGRLRLGPFARCRTWVPESRPRRRWHAVRSDGTNDWGDDSGTLLLNPGTA